MYNSKNSVLFMTVGKPIDVKKTKNPTTEDITELQNKYVDALRKLFEENKEKYEPNQSIKLEIN